MVCLHGYVFIRQEEIFGWTFSPRFSLVIRKYDSTHFKTLEPWILLVIAVNR